MGRCKFVFLQAKPTVLWGNVSPRLTSCNSPEESSSWTKLANHAGDTQPILENSISRSIVVISRMFLSVIPFFSKAQLMYWRVRFSSSSIIKVALEKRSLLSELQGEISEIVFCGYKCILYRTQGMKRKVFQVLGFSH